jgi:hypothetical protein
LQSIKKVLSGKCVGMTMDYLTKSNINKCFW